MPVPLLFYPASFKALLTVAVPWLTGGAALGTLAGRQSVENDKQRAQLAKQQAKIERLATMNAELAARLETQTPPANPKKAPQTKRQSKKHGFLKKLLDANLKLREETKTEDSTGEQYRD